MFDKCLSRELGLLVMTYLKCLSHELGLLVMTCLISVYRVNLVCWL